MVTYGWNSRLSVVAGAMAMMMLSASSHGQTGQPTATSNPQVSSTINAATVSCRDLKANLQRAGTLTIVSEPRGWADTYYGPAVPQCEFWLKPKFSYVSTNDGACDVGYTCVDRVTAGR